MIKLYIQNKYITSKKYLKIIDNIKTNKVLIFYFDNKPSNYLNDSLNIVICSQKLNIKNSFNSFIPAMKKILSLLDIKNKLIYLKKICYGIPFLIFTCGPTSNTYFNIIDKIQDNYIILSVKYSRDILINHQINIDFTITSDFSNTIFNNIIPNENNTISLHMCDINKHSKIIKDMFFIPNTKQNHLTILNNVCINNSIELLQINPNNIRNESIVVNLAHIMLEIAIPFSTYIGAENIFTFGWDGPDSKNTYSYLNNIKNTDFDYNKTEYKFIEKIAYLFKNQGINIYKGSKDSPIKLEYKSIFEEYDELVIEQDNELKKSISIGIKTFCRPKCLDCNLTKIWDLGLYNTFPIIIADDSNLKYKSLNKEIVNKYINKGMNIKYISLDFDTGLSYGRNMIVENCLTKYLVIIDDSRTLTYKTDLIKMAKFLNNYNYNLLAGQISNRDGFHRTYCKKFTKFKNVNNVVNIYTKDINNISDKVNNNIIDNVFDTDMTLNVFIADTHSLKMTTWRNQLKVGEHETFFYDYKMNGFKCAISLEIDFLQLNDSLRQYPPDITYKYRDRANNLKDKYVKLI